MKVARCKHCHKAFHMSIWPLERPSEDLTMSVRLNNYDQLFDLQHEFDEHIRHGHAVTIEPLSNETLDCRCRHDERLLK